MVTTSLRRLDLGWRCGCWAVVLLLMPLLITAIMELNTSQPPKAATNVIRFTQLSRTIVMKLTVLPAVCLQRLVV